MIDARLEGIVDRMLSRCFRDGQYRQALGIALETRRMDVFQKAIMESVRGDGVLGGHWLGWSLCWKGGGH